MTDPETYTLHPTPHEINAKYTDLTYLGRHTKGNPELMMQMIKLYIDQTLPLICKMKQSSDDKDWSALYNSVHKMIPSFSIMGIHKDYEDMARKIQLYTSSQQSLGDVNALVLKLEDVCSRACEELTEAYQLIKINSENERK